jgi:hypothetical protein
VVNLNFGDASGFANFTGPGTYSISFAAIVQEFYSDKWSASGLTRLALCNFDQLNSATSFYCDGAIHPTPEPEWDSFVQLNGAGMCSDIRGFIINCCLFVVVFWVCCSLSI